MTTLLFYSEGDPFTVQYALCEITSIMSLVSTDWLQENNCQNLAILISDTYDIRVEVNTKALFYVIDEKRAKDGNQIIYIKTCYKPGEAVLQYIDRTGDNNCPGSYKMSVVKKFAAPSPCMLFYTL